MRKSFTRLSVMLMLTILVFTSVPLFSEGTSETNDTNSQATRTEAYSGETSLGPAIIASTSWVAAIIESSGAQNVTTLAPNTLKHPPEYDFSPSDIIRATKADLLFWAGYEGFMNELFTAAEIDDSRIVRVNTGYTVELLSENIRRISPLFGTSEEGEQQIEQIEQLFSTLKEKVSQLSEEERSVIVQFHQKPFIEELGYTVVATVGPGDLSIGDVKAIEDLSFSLIIDNYHSPGAQTFENEGRKYIQLINFPGPFDTDSVISVIEYNAKMLGLLDT